MHWDPRFGGDARSLAGNLSAVHFATFQQGRACCAKFAQQLSRYGYSSHTGIWLDEVSSFTVDFSGHHYSRAIQAQGAHDLLTYLPRAGGASVSGEPVVARIYYMRYAGAPHDALIVGHTREPIYWTFASRRK
jgi:hypothetical protein